MCTVAFCVSSPLQGYDHTIRFWQASTGMCERTIQYQDSQVNCLDITPDKKFLAAAGNPHVRLFDTTGHNANALNQSSGHTGNVTAIGFQREGKWLFSGSEDGTIRLWDLRAQQAQREFDNKEPINAVALHPDQATLLFGDHDGYTRVLDLQTNKISFEEQKEGDTPVRSVATAADGSLYVVANNNGNCHLWDPSKPQPEASTAPGGSPGGTPVVTTVGGDEGTTAEGSEGGGEDGGGSSATTAAAAATAATDSADGAEAGEGQGGGAATPGSAEESGDRSEAAEDAEAAAAAEALAEPGATRKLEAHPGSYILKCKVSLDGTMLATASSDHTVRLFDPTNLAKNPVVLANHQRWVWDVSFSADSSYLVTASSDSSARLWDVGGARTTLMGGQVSQPEVIKHYTGHQKACTCVALNDANDM